MVIGAVEEIPRERFVDKTLEGVAYLDEDLPIAPGRNLMEPMVFSRLAQALEIQLVKMAGAPAVEAILTSHRELCIAKCKGRKKVAVAKSCIEGWESIPCRGPEAPPEALSSKESEPADNAKVKRH